MLQTLAIMLMAAPFQSSLSERLVPRKRRYRFLDKVLRHVGTPIANPGIRGAGVATDAFVSMATTTLDPDRWRLYLPQEQTRSAQKWVERAFQRPVPVDIAAFPVLSTDRINGTDIGAWLDPGGAAPIALRLRKLFSQDNSYPIVSVQHTLSLHTLLSGYFPPLLLEPTWPWDSLVCSTMASARAMQNLLEYTAEQQMKVGGDRCDWVPQFAGRIDVIPLPVDTDRFVPGNKVASRRNFGISEDAFVILYLGHVGPTKADLIPFLGPLREIVSARRQNQVHFVVAGACHPPYSEVLRDRIRQEGLLPLVTLLGGVSANEKVLLYQAADVFFSPSDTLQESFGLTAIEAMSCGLPQLVSDWNGYKDTVVDGRTGFRLSTTWAQCDGDLSSSGYLLGSNFDHLLLGQSVAVNLQQFKERLSQLIESPDLRATMAENSRRSALELYSFKSVGLRYLSLLRELSQMRKQSGAPLRSMQVDSGTPQYNRCFGHYPTTLLTADTRLRACIAHKEPPTRRIAEQLRTLGAESTLRTQSLLEVLSLLDGHGRSAGEIYCHFGTGSLAAISDLNRHIMWLMKMGFIAATD
jgi:D-inositol-3-phosphate glycosyltransferase